MWRMAVRWRRGGLGTLTVDLGSGGVAQFDAGSYFTFTLGAAGLSDRIEFTGAGGVTFNDNLLHFVDLTGGLLEAGTTYELFRVSDESTISGGLAIGSGLEAYAGSTLSIEAGMVRLETKPIPEPGTVWLIGAGLAGLGGFRRKRPTVASTGR